MGGAAPRPRQGFRNPWTPTIGIQAPLAVPGCAVLCCPPAATMGKGNSVMAGTIESRLAELGIDLPRPTAPAANYVPYVISGALVFVSGQVTMGDGGLKFLGRLGEDLSVDEGYQAARLCGLNLIAQAREAAGGDLDRIRRVVKLGGFVNCAPDFTDHPKVMNGASDLMVEVFGEAGRHARFAVGAPALPLGVAVEVDGVFEVG